MSIGNRTDGNLLALAEPCQRAFRPCCPAADPIAETPGPPAHPGFPRCPVVSLYGFTVNPYYV